MTSPTDFDEDAPTDVVNPGAFPELEVDEEDITTPVRTLCSRCLRPAKTGGDALPTWEVMVANASDACYRSMGDVWWWCSGWKPFHLLLTGTDAKE